MDGREDVNSLDFLPKVQLRLPERHLREGFVMEVESLLASHMKNILTYSSNSQIDHQYHPHLFDYTDSSNLDVSQSVYSRMFYFPDEKTRPLPFIPVIAYNLTHIPSKAIFIDRSHWRIIASIQH